MGSYRYIIVTENSEVFQTDTITASERSAADEAVLDIIDIEDRTFYYMDEWHPIKEWETE